MGNSCNRAFNLALVYNKNRNRVCSSPALKSARNLCLLSIKHNGTHLGSTGQPITRLADANVQAQLPDVKIAHHILRLVTLDLLAIDSFLGGLQERDSQLAFVSWATHFATERTNIPPLYFRWLSVTKTWCHEPGSDYLKLKEEYSSCTESRSTVRLRAPSYAFCTGA